MGRNRRDGGSEQKGGSYRSCKHLAGLWTTADTSPKTPLNSMCHLTVPAVTTPAAVPTACARVPALLSARLRLAGKGGQQGLWHTLGINPRKQELWSVGVLLASKCLSPSSQTGTAAVSCRTGHLCSSLSLLLFALESQPGGTGRDGRRPNCVWLRTGHSTSGPLLLKLLQP